MNPNRRSDSDEVLVVGAGPVGLAAALAFDAAGIPVTVVEADPRNRSRPGSRAIYLHGTTLQVLNELCSGLGYELAAHGLVWPTRRTTYKGRTVFERTYQQRPLPAGRLPHFTSLSQAEMERLLQAACVRRGIEIEWDKPVDSVEASPEGVRVGMKDGSRYETAYIIGADGARSTVREQLDIKLQGDRSLNTFVIADVSEDRSAPLALERAFHYLHPAVGGRNVLLVPFAGGWRADLQLRPGDDPVEFSQGGGLSRWIAAVLGGNLADRISWVSTYQFLQVIAQSFTDPMGRVLLVGEAAHLFAPFGARGLNSGVADAAAAAMAVCSARAAGSESERRAAIDGFGRDRRAAAEWNRNAAGIALRHMQALEFGVRLKRALAASLSRVFEHAGEWLDTAPYGPTGQPPTESRSRY